MPGGQVQREVLHEEGVGEARGHEAQEGRPERHGHHVWHLWKTSEKSGAAMAAAAAGIQRLISWKLYSTIVPFAQLLIGILA